MERTNTIVTTDSSASSHCTKCGGFVGEPGKIYGYAGKWCQCGWQDWSMTPSPEYQKVLDNLAEQNKEIKRLLDSIDKKLDKNIPE